MNVSVSSLDVVPIQMGAGLVSITVFKTSTAVLTSMVLVVSLSSTVLNILNIYTFLNLQQNTVSICLISLALSDLTSMLILSNGSIITLIPAIFDVPWARNVPAFHFLLALGHSLAMDMTSAITTYIAIQRGICVTLPFLARNAFSKNTSLVVCVALFLTMLTLTLLRLTAFRLNSVPDPVNNSSTLLVIEYYESRAQFEYFYFIVMKTALVFIEFGLMVVCTVAIYIGMQSSMKLKDKTASIQTHREIEPGSEASTTKRKIKDTKSKDDPQNATKDQPQAKKQTKESIVVKQSFMVVFIHVVLTTPRVLACVYRLLDSRFRVGGQLHNLFIIIFSAINVIDAINAFVNFFVYVKFDARFRMLLLTKVCCREPEMSKGS
ncbi:hypothetical protein EGW08_006726 [Elysia chlorotica]|uniref:G-protein coupled receptors family 1 profile domain-containing protein n=1 Tax=Elysia chlorotica TaxID=188477 RepID=A0A3S0ZS37_ELYCH|nr:hypothetical protein EGW08_006726 [Elysia chlorotica]